MKLKFILKKKVLYIIDTLEVGGAERSTLEIASRLKHWHPVICQLYKGSSLLSDYSLSKNQLINFGLKGPYQFWKASRKLLDALEHTKPDLVVATLLRSELVARYCCRKKGIPIVGTFVNDTYSTYELRNIKFSLRWKIRFFQLLNGLSARWCVLFLSNSVSIKDSNTRALLIPTSKVVVIPRGRRVPDHFPARRVIDNQYPVFCNVGRLIRRKGQMELLKAFELLLADYPGASLRIAGEGVFRKELEQYIEEKNLKGRVELLGTERRIEDFYRKADIAVFPSYYEGFSGAVLEATLAGIPILLSDIPMNKEVVPSDGAIFFPVMNVEALYQSMLEVLKNHDQALVRSRVAFSFAAGKFDIEVIARRHEEIYDKVISGLK